MAVYSVTTDASMGAGSLRGAIIDANNNPGPDTIRFGINVWGETIQLGTALPEITEAVEINGPAAVAGRVTIDANGRPFRPLTIDANAADVVINNLVLTGGDVRAETGADRFGGGLANSGTRTVLDNVIVEDNFAARGGGVYNDGDMTIRNSRISENVAESDLLSSLGGGIFNNGGTVDLSFSTVRDNQAVGLGNGAEGGGIAMLGGRTKIEHSSIHGNEVDESTGRKHGGGISAKRIAGAGILDTASINIFASTIRDNSAVGDGGGIYSEDVGTTIDSSTIADNASVSGMGGGVYISAMEPVGTVGGSANTDLINNTITGNSAATTGGVFVEHQDVADLIASVVAENTDDSGAASDINGPTVNQGTFLGEVDGDPMLSPLGDNGGPVWTRVPIAGSPLLDAALSAGSNAAVDARLNPRQVDGNRDGIAVRDIGAVEYVPQSNISGRVVNDLNGDGVLGTTENGLNGWTVQLVDPATSLIVAEAITESIDHDGDGTINDATEAGFYSFDATDNGEYELKLDLPDYWQIIDSPDIDRLIVDIVDADFFVEPVKQELFVDEDEIRVPIPHSGPVSFPVNYQTSDDGLTTGLAVRAHFDSSWLAFNHVATEEPTLFTDAQVVLDTEDWDNNPLTDQFVLISFIDSSGQFPKHDTMPTDLFTLNFDHAPSADHPSGVGTTEIAFTAASHDARYQFEGDTVSMTFYNATLDVDDNGSVDALSDGLLITRFLLGATGTDLVEFATSPTANRTDPGEIRDYLEGLRYTMLDVTGDGIATAFDDGTTISRYMIGYQGDALAGFTFASSTRTTGEEITAFLDTFMPGYVGIPGVVTSSPQAEQIETVQPDPDRLFPDPPQLVGTQIVHTTSTEASRPTQALLNVRYETSPIDLDTLGLATRVHYDSSKLRLDTADHFVRDFVVDQVFADTEDWDDDPETDEYFMSAFIDPDGNWDSVISDDMVSRLRFDVLDVDSGPARINVTAVETPGQMNFEASGTSIALTHTNEVFPADVNGDGKITPFDALLIINELKDTGRDLESLNFSSNYIDTNSDKVLTPFDAVLVINELSRLAKLET